MKKGQFITFEGGEGAGKTTQLTRLKDRLREDGVDVVTTREPGGVPAAELLRDLVVKGDVDSWSVMSELLIFTAARVEHVQRKIIPALNAGKWVLCDRFYDSSAVYQGVAGGLGIDAVMQVQKLALGDIAPDLTLIFDLPADVGLSRAGKREHETGAGEDRFERKGLAFHEKLRQGFRTIADTNDRAVLIDASGTIDQIEARINDIIKGIGQ